MMVFFKLKCFVLLRPGKKTMIKPEPHSIGSNLLLGVQATLKILLSNMSSGIIINDDPKAVELDVNYEYRHHHLTNSLSLFSTCRQEST